MLAPTRQPLVYGSPYGLGGLSRRDRQGQSVPLCLFVLLVQRSPWGVGRPTFRTVWSRRREAGLAESRTGCRMIISGRTGGDTSAKSFYFPCRRSEPAATQRLPRGREWVSPRRKGTSRLFLSPPSFFFTHEKERRGAGATLARKGRGLLPRIPTPNPDSAFRPKRPSISATRRSPACLGDNTPIVHGIPLS